ncbi:MAG: aa3-type cytochrome c oxidase subunit IV [Brevundimonas sp.]
MADHHNSDDYVRGSQEISEQVSTYELFMNLAKWGSLLTAAVLLFLTLAFMHGGSIITGLIAGIGLFVVGWFFLRAKPAAH